MDAVGLGYGCHEYVNLNEGYESLRNNMKVVDKVAPHVYEKFDAGRETLEEITHTTKLEYSDDHYFEKKTPRIVDGADFFSGLAQNAALGAAFLSFLYLMYCGIRGKK